MLDYPGPEGEFIPINIGTKMRILAGRVLPLGAPISCAMLRLVCSAHPSKCL